MDDEKVLFDFLEEEPEGCATTNLAPLPTNEDSLLDPETLRELATSSSSLPAAFLHHSAGHLDSTQSIIDFATTVCMSVADGKIKVSQSAELRRWAELMYSCVISQSGSSQSTQVNYIGQLVQLAGAQAIADDPVGREVIEVQEALSSPAKARAHKKAQGD